MPVLKTTSPVIVFSAPNPLPRRMVPSSRIREASFSEPGTFDLEMVGFPIPNLKRLCPGLDSRPNADKHRIGLQDSFDTLSVGLVYFRPQRTTYSARLPSCGRYFVS